MKHCLLLLSFALLAPGCAQAAPLLAPDVGACAIHGKPGWKPLKVPKHRNGSKAPVPPKPVLRIAPRKPGW